MRYRRAAAKLWRARAVNFTSDNGAGVAPEILEAILATSRGSEPAYGADAETASAEAAVDAIFGRKCATFLVATGTAANALALASLARPFEAIFCHEEAHIQDDECGAPEMFSAGAKIVGIAGVGGKISPRGWRETLERFPRGRVHGVQPAALSLSQVTEAGTLYGLDEIAALSAIARQAGLGVHLDGARFANALAALGCSPADMTWRAGVDVLSLGATKNGALACEAVVFFDPEKAASFPFQRKRSGHLLSKGRFLGAQMHAYLRDGLWLRLAAKANAAAARLAAGLGAVAGARLAWPAQANEVFAILPRRALAPLRAAGAQFYEWNSRAFAAGEAPKADEICVRLVCSFATESAEVEAFLAALREHCD